MDNDSIENLQDFYRKMGIDETSIGQANGFKIHRVKKSFKNLPYRSEHFSPNYYNFLFSKDGDGSYIIDNQSFPVNNRTVYFTNLGNFRTFEWIRFSDACLITFDETFLKENTDKDIFEKFPYLLTETVCPRTLTPDQFARVENLYSLIEQESLSPSPFQHKVIGSLLMSLLWMIKEYCYLNYNPIYEGNRRSLIVKDFKVNVEQYFKDILNGKTGQSMRVQYFAELQHLHVNNLSNVISNKTGKTMLHWINEKAISTARILLRNSTLSIKEISYRMGFLESAHFSNYFKKQTAESPALLYLIKNEV